MPQQELLKKVIQVLDQTRIKYMITGSEVQYEKLDLDYLEQWVKILNVESLWKRLVDEAETV
ncbi:hypothetical protein DK28_0215580 [Peptococcaceae bacterium SCADC1_2_3]|jgi:hypothetical protein|nr:hypothetical protein DK28_0215580 [Peptococcaceae bacterium SCADC1_2_3]KFI35766.1 hypothetical protein HY00_01705 [Peptococcaceae bacterium SCADC1_2_3]